MNNYAKTRLLLASALILLPLFVAASAQDQIITRITGDGPRAIRIAVPEVKFPTLSPETIALEKVFNETLWNDLEFTGNLELAGRSFYPTGTFAEPRDIKGDDWRATSALYIAYGRLTIAGGRLNLSGYLRDLTAATEAFGQAFAGGNDEDGARRVAHRFADRILEQLGLGKGISQTQIAFVSDRSGDKEIWVMDYDGSNQRRLTSVRNLAIAPSWSPVDDRIAYTAWRTAGPHIEIVSSTGERHNFKQVGDNQVPMWTSDGKSILYTSNRDGNSELYWADADGSNARRLTNSSGSIDTSASVNPKTGRQVAFISNRHGTPQLYLMDSDGSNVTRITEEGGDAENPAYSPDGSMIAFAWQKPKSNGFDIFVYNIGMRKFQQLTSDSGRNERPTWAPDGKHIAFQSTRGGSTQIYAMTLDGLHVLPLTKAGRNEGPTWSGPSR